ncbi:hypothetical protein Droror1_Dr00000953 [Drosera rotundifolia]
MNLVAASVLQRTACGDDEDVELDGGLTTHNNGGDVGLGGVPTMHGDDDRLAAGQRDLDGAACQDHGITTTIDATGMDLFLEQWHQKLPLINHLRDTDSGRHIHLDAMDGHGRHLGAIDLHFLNPKLVHHLSYVYPVT